MSSRVATGGLTWPRSSASSLEELIEGKWTHDTGRGRRRRDGAESGGNGDQIGCGQAEMMRYALTIALRRNRERLGPLRYGGLAGSNLVMRMQKKEHEIGDRDKNGVMKVER